MARRISKILLMGSIAPVLTFTPPHAFAQSGTGGSETDNARSSAPEASRSAEIIVTARRREESLQTVPVAVAVVGAETIAAQGIQTTGDIQKLVPGVILTGAGSMSNSTYTISRQGKAVTGPGLPSVITYFNEVPLPSTGRLAPTFDVHNVTFLKRAEVR